MPYGESASAQVVIVTCVYYVGLGLGVMTAYCIPRLSAMGRSPPVALAATVTLGRTRCSKSD